MHYFFYLIGLLLLAAPTGLLNRKRVKLVTLREIFERRRPRERIDFLHSMNLVDLLRAYAGVTALQTAFLRVNDAALVFPLVQGLLAGAALLGLILQHCFYATPRSELPAPAAYSLGLVIALLPIEVSMLALPVGVITALAVQNLGLGWILASGITAVLGKLFGAPLILLAAGSIVLAFSATMAGLLHRRLALMVIRGREPRPRTLRDVTLKVTR
jgi:hypothetical protein